MNFGLRLATLLLILVVLSPALWAQEPLSPDKGFDFGFIPGEASKRLARMKAGSLEKQRVTEKALLSQIQSEIDRYDITYYDIYWRPDFSDSSIYGEVGIYGRSLDPTLNRVMLQLSEDMHVDSVYDASGRIPSTHAGDLLYVYLDHTYDINEEFGFTVKYEGQVPPINFFYEGLMFTTHHGVPIVENLSEPYSAHTWWPCKDVPWDKADSTDVQITCDTGMIATSNGLLISDTDHGDGTHTAHWRHRYPITTYNICIAVTNYVSQTDYYVYSPTDSMPIVNYIMAEYADDEQIAYGVSAQALAVFSNLFGQYPFLNEKFGHSMCNVHGMEHQTNTFLNHYFSCDEPTVVHELAHHWWGNLVTCKSWEHVWLQEGIGTHAEALFYEVLYGREAYQAYMDGIKYLDSGTVYVYDVSDPWVIFDTRSYWKGAWVSHMLRGVVGDSAYFNGLKLYGQTFAYGNATSDDLKDVMETVSGQDLEYFFDEWLYGEYFPRYRYAWMAEDDASGGENIYLYISQQQSTEPQVFTMPIDIHLETDTDTTVVTVFNTKREQCFTINTEYQVNSLQFDPHEWILRSAQPQEFHVHIVTEELAAPVLTDWYTDTIMAKGGSGDFIYSLEAGSLPDGLTLDGSTGIVSGYCMAGDSFNFTVKATDIVYPQDYYDFKTYNVTTETPDDRPGDANADGEANVGDAVFLINFIFKGGPAPYFPNWADVNVDCQVNVGDAVFLINFVFKEGPVPQLGCVE